MKILVLSDHYLPEIKAPSFRVSEHAKRWLAAGHDVTVVTSAPNYPRGRVFDGYRNRPYQEEVVEGVRVVRVGTYITNKPTALRRFADHFSFVLSSALFCWRLPKCDVILATSPPLFTALAGWVLSVLLRKPWVFEVRDLWPATIKAVTRLPGWLIRWLERLELFLYRRADQIVVVTQGFQRILVERGIDAGKITVATNGVEPEKFRASNRRRQVRESLNVADGTLLVGYFGTIGMCQDLSNAIRAMNLLDRGRDIQLLIVGEGAERPLLEKLIEQESLDNVTLLDVVPQEELPDYYAAIDVSLVHLKRDPTFETVIPSKMFEAMATGTPLLMAADGEAAEIVSTARCGCCVEPGNPRALADSLVRLADDRSQLARMGAAGADAVRRDYSRQANAARVLSSMLAATGRAGSAAMLSSPHTSARTQQAA